MIRVLILDDSSEKVQVIRRFLKDECNIDDQFVDERNTIKEGRKILYLNDYDLLLLDLVMPRDSESEPTAAESIKFLDEIYFNSSIHIPVHIIGFSQYDELIESHNDTFEDKLWHLINFSFTDNSWRDKLKSKIFHLISFKNRFKESIEQSSNFDIGIICALESPELREVLDLQCSWRRIEFERDPNVYHEGLISTVKGNSYRLIACSVNKMGMQATASVSSMMIARFNLKYLFMTGICAGVRERDLNFGDVIVAESLTDYGSGKIIESSNGNFTLKPEPHQFPTDQGLIAKMNSFIRENKELLSIQTNYKGLEGKNVLKAWIGPVASGSYVVASKSLIDSITESNRKLIGIDMEGYGLYLACHFFSQTKPLFIKSVCDFGDSEKNDTHQKYAAYTSARFLSAFIINVM